ncbi:hypothetical protein ACFW2X_01350 [Streptomyces antibioticus]|uniref:hypothetical protein n=1 Tax=Streptomyces antibioticus TaxID=1890 RepID=UPI003697518F
MSTTSRTAVVTARPLCRARTPTPTQNSRTRPTVPSLSRASAPLTPAFKLYLLNGSQALQAPYEVIERDIRLDSGEVVKALDVLGFRAAITRHVTNADPDSHDTFFVDSWQRWFDSVWNQVAVAQPK